MSECGLSVYEAAAAMFVRGGVSVVVMKLCAVEGARVEFESRASCM